MGFHVLYLEVENMETHIRSGEEQRIGVPHYNRVSFVVSFSLSTVEKE